ncbi:hypothetical protein ACQP2T_63980 (plasmid) [Nonomuraea sp. CA-143628]|uniref:hypothetical protein n=1 Tax=Nonomuraea sp. CA-143628 TaxID=3239997 RepID=UPI003D918D60
MTPAEVIEAALREHFKLCLKPSAIEQAQRGHRLYLSGAQAEDAARIVVDALAGAGLVVVSAEDIIDALSAVTAVSTGQTFAAHLHAKDRLLAAARAALPEEADHRD